MTYQPPPTPPPPVDPAALRPGRIWYWIAGIVVVLGVCLGPGLAVLGFRSLTGALPEMSQEFDAGTRTTVDLTSDQDWAIYVAKPGRSGEGTAPRPDVECAVEGRAVTLSRSDVNLEFDKGNRHWQLVYDISVDRNGSYPIACVSNDPSLPDPTFAVGEAVNVRGLAGTAIGSLGALLGIPCLALVVAGVIALLTALRRNAHKKRLQESGGAAGAAPPGYVGTEPVQPGAPPPGAPPPAQPPGTPPPGPSGQQPPTPPPAGPPPSGPPPAGPPPSGPPPAGPPPSGPPPTGPPPSGPPA